MAGPIRIAILADSRQAVTGLGKTGRAAETLGTKFRGASVAVAKYAAAGAALAAGAAVVGLAKLAAGAAEDEQAANLLAKALKNSAGATDQQVAAVERYISRVGAATGVTDDQLRPALSKLVTATGDVGKAQKLASLALDVSAGSGKSLEQVSTALAKAQNGSVAGLTRLGIATKDAEGNTISFGDATSALGKKFGGAAATKADTLQGKIDRLKVIVSEAGEAIGYKVIPPLTRFAEYVIKNGVPAASKLGEAVRRKVAPVLADLGPLLKDVGGVLKDKVVPAIQSTVEFFDKYQNIIVPLAAAIGAMVAAFQVASAVTKAFTAVQAALNLVMSANPIALIALAIVGLAAGLVVAYKKSETFRNVVDGALSAVKSAAQSVADFFTKKIPAAFNKVVDAAKSVLGWIKSNWPLLLALLTGPIGLAVLAIAKKWDAIKSGATQLKDKIAGIATGIKDALVKAFQAVVDKVTAVYDKIVGAIQKAKDLAAAVKIGGKSSPQAPGPLGGPPKPAPGGPTARKAAAPIGDAFVRGIADGFAFGLDSVEKALTGVTSLIDTTVSKNLDKTISKLKKKLKGAALDRATAKAERASKKNQRAILTSLQGQYVAARAKGAEQDGLNAQLDEAVKKYDDLVKAAEEYAASVRDGVVAFGNITGTGGSEGFGTVEQLIEQLKGKVATAQTYSDVIQQLTAAGLNQTNLQQLIDAGVEGGLGTAQAILAGGPAAINQINILTGQLVATGTTLGTTTAATMKNAGIQAAAGIVAGLQSQIATVAAAATEIGEVIARAVRKALKIKSPSRIMRGLGRFTGQGLVLGVDDQVRSVESAGARLAQALQTGYTASSAYSAFTASSTSSQAMSIDLTLSASQVDQLSRGRAIRADLDAFARAGGRPAS